MRDVKIFLFYFAFFLFIRVSFVRLDGISSLVDYERVPTSNNMSLSRLSNPDYSISIVTNKKNSANPESAIPEGAFLRGELLELVTNWEASSITTEEAKSELWRIVSQPSYIHHRPLHGIVFVKTHKTGSSTISSVLHSLATAHNLTTPITMDTTAYIPQEERFRILNLDTTQPNVTSAPYDVWCNHVVYDNLLTDKVVPSSRQFVVSIVRDPATRVRSACQHYGCCPSQYSDENVFNDFVFSNRAKRLFKRNKSHCRVDQSSFQIVGTGLEPSKPFDENFEQVLERARENKFLLLVTERMVESMLVLQHVYNLHPLDVAFLSKKVKTATFSNNKQQSNTTIAAEALIRKWNPYDTRIHAVANELLTRHLEVIFPDTTVRKQAQEQLQSLNNFLFHVCSNPKKNEELESSSLELLNDWCEEKALDNWEWNKKHLKIVKKQRKAFASGY